MAFERLNVDGDFFFFRGFLVPCCFTRSDSETSLSLITSLSLRMGFVDRREKLPYFITIREKQAKLLLIRENWVFKYKDKLESFTEN